MPSTRFAAAVRMTIYNSKGQVVFTLVVYNQETLSANVYLPQDTYVVRFAGGTPNGSPLPALTYKLRGEGESDQQSLQAPVVSQVADRIFKHFELAAL